MKASELRKLIGANTLGIGNVSFNWIQPIQTFDKMFIVDDVDKIGFMFSDKEDAKVISLTDFYMEAYKREDGKRILLYFWSRDGREMSVVAELKEVEEKNDKSTSNFDLIVAFELQNALAENIIHSMFNGQSITPSVEWVQKNCIENKKFDEFVGEWLKNNDTDGLLASLRGDVFKTNVQKGVYALLSYLRIASLNKNLCEDILRCVLNKPKS